MRKGSKRDKMEQEALLLAERMIETQCTIMELEKMFCIPNTTIHRRLTKTLVFVDLDMWDECQHILKAHGADALNRARRALEVMRLGKSVQKDEHER